jgi:hypothetical protein
VCRIAYKLGLAWTSHRVISSNCQLRLRCSSGWNRGEIHHRHAPCVVREMCKQLGKVGSSFFSCHAGVGGRYVPWFGRGGQSTAAIRSRNGPGGGRTSIPIREGHGRNSDSRTKRPVLPCFFKHIWGESGASVRWRCHPDVPATLHLLLSTYRGVAATATGSHTGRTSWWARGLRMCC